MIVITQQRCLTSRPIRWDNNNLIFDSIKCCISATIALDVQKSIHSGSVIIDWLWLRVIDSRIHLCLCIGLRCRNCMLLRTHTISIGWDSTQYTGTINQIISIDFGGIFTNDTGNSKWLWTHLGWNIYSIVSRLRFPIVKMKISFGVFRAYLFVLLFVWIILVMMIIRGKYSLFHFRSAMGFDA